MSKHCPILRMAWPLKDSATSATIGDADDACFQSMKGVVGHIHPPLEPLGFAGDAK